VTFLRPFILTGFDAVQAAGTYIIDIDEEPIEGLSFPAYRRVSTQMQVSARGVIEHRFIDPAELDEALARDAAQQEPLVRRNKAREGARGMLKSRLSRRR
jgi:hypothetical protein